jgi:hypothetical protein
MATFTRCTFNDNVSDGTSLQGYITTNIQNLKKVLGDPTYEGNDDKVTCEWVIKFADDTVATVYDWKERSTPQGEYDWHIGGHDKIAVAAIRKLFESAGIRAPVKTGW